MGKKKHRQITINGDESWAWGVVRDDHHGRSYFRVWKKKKLLYERAFISEPEWVNPPTGMPTITPKFASKFIKMYLMDK